MVIKTTVVKKRAKAKKAQACPKCGSSQVVPVLHGYITPALQHSIDLGRAVLSDREEWEGMTEWYCKKCRCDWSGKWRRFKVPGSVNATRTNS